ncbi:MAG: DNA polymerase III [Bacteroidota bacterium]|nr:DNA polymerase III [Bacteroidota bacterium]
MSIKGVQQLNELIRQNNKLLLERKTEFLKESFTENDLKIYWTKFKEKLHREGKYIASSLMDMNQIQLQDTIIYYKVPNENSKLEIERILNELLSYLRGHLKNHNINIIFDIDQDIKVKRPLTKFEIFQQLIQKNPALETLRKTLDLKIQ